jgi:hypothetical protein
MLSRREDLLDSIILHKDYKAEQVVSVDQSVGRRYYAYCFNDDVFGNIDWTIEPSISLSDLYKLRAQQIRDEYDYVILSFSGGSDSVEVLETFLEHNIFIDEIQTVHYDSLIARRDENEVAKDDSLSVMLEYRKAVIPKLQRVRKLSPNTKITEIDVSDYTYEQISKNKFDYMGLTGKETNGTNVTRPLRTNTFYMHNYNNSNFKAKGKVAFVRGYDKPILSIDNNHLYFRFSDIPLHGVKLLRSGQINDMYTFEDFFWSRNMPLIPVKQSHVLKRAMELDQYLYDRVANYNKETADFLEPVERLYSRIIYKYTDTIGFIGAKPATNPELKIVNQLTKTYSKDIMDERASYYTKKYAAIENKELMRKPIYTKPYDLGELKR